MIYVLWNNGHASLALTGLNKKNIYISVFAPVNMSGQIDFSNGQGLRLHKLEWDLANNLFPYQKIAAVPTIESCGFGLSEIAIYNWWKQIDGKNFSFSINNNNCRTVVADALLEGINHSATLSESARKKLSECINRSNPNASINWKTFIEIINNNLESSNKYKRIFAALAMIDKNIDALFIEGNLIDHLISINCKLTELKELSPYAPDVLQLVFEIELTLIDILKNYLMVMQVDSDIPSLEDGIQKAAKVELKNKTIFKTDKTYNELNSRCKMYLNLRYTFWGDTESRFKNDKLIKTIKDEINSDNNPQKDFFRNRSAAVSFVK